MRASLSLAVIEAIADAEGVEAVELETPLADVIDPDALEAVFRNGDGAVSFTYGRHRVTAAADGTVEVGPVRPA